MKKLTNLIALVMLVSTNVMTPISYAQQTQESNLPEISVETWEVEVEQQEKVTDLWEEENQLLDALAWEENGQEKENQDFPENLNEENKIFDNLEWWDTQILDNLEESDNQQEWEKQSQTETPIQIDAPEKPLQTEIQEDEELEDSMMMNGEKDIKAQAEPNKVTITYNLNWWYWTEDNTTDAKTVTFTLDTNNMVSTTDRKTPSKSDGCEENGEMKKCMFDGWYLENGERWIWYATSDMTVYAKWLPFEDLIITTWGVTFTIMDRNIWAIVADVTNTDSYWYHFQWWNNYGFKRYRNGEYKFPNWEKSVWVKSTDRTWYISTYYKWIWISENPWNDGAIANDNLWWWSETSNSDTDRQWPCPDGYHVPDTLEWKAVWSLLKAWDSGYIVRDTLNLPFAGYRAKGQFVYNMGTIGRYWSSTPSDISNAYYLYFKSPSISIPNDWQSYYSRSHGFSVRCFQNSSPQTLTFSTDWWELDTSIISTVRWWEEWEELPIPTKYGSAFLWWYTSSSYDADTKVETNAITSDGPVTLYAKWEECGEWYKVVNNTCIDERAWIFYESGYIKITDGKDSVYIKDKNQWAENSLNAARLIDDYKMYLGDLLLSGSIKYEDFDKMLLEYVNSILWNKFNTIEEFDEFYEWDEFLDSTYWDYYRWWNNSWVNYQDLVVEDDYTINKEYLWEWFLSKWKVWMPEWNGWIEWNTNNPCDASKWEYLPTLSDWEKLFSLWAKLNGYDIRKWNDYYNSYVWINFQEETEILQLKTDFLFNITPTIQSDWEDFSIWLWFEIPVAWMWQDMYWNLWYMWWRGDNWYMVWARYGKLNEENQEYLNSIAMPVRCFMMVNPVDVNFETNGANETISSQKISSWNKVSEPSIPTKNWYTFAWWYTDDGEKWDFDTDRVENNMTLYAKWKICGEWFKVKWNKCIPNDVDTQKIIWITDWTDTVYLKDRNQWVTNDKAVEYLKMMLDIWSHLNQCWSVDEDCIKEITIEHVNELWHTNYSWSDMDMDEIMEKLEEYYWVSNPEEQTYWNYYYRWNNSWVNYEDFQIENNIIMNKEDLWEWFLSKWKAWMPEWSGWIEWNTNNPCDASKWEYLPTLSDWEKVFRLRWNKNGYAINSWDNFIWISFDDFYEIYKLGKDISFYITPTINSDWEDLRIWLWWAIPVAWIWQDYDWNLWAIWWWNGLWNLIDVWVHYTRFDDDEVDDLNSIAMPVRCFVKVPDVFVVDYDSNGWDVVKSQNVISWEVINQPESPIRWGYIFGWWYSDKSLTQEFDFTTPITSNITLYAKWIDNQKNNGYSGGWSRWWSNSEKSAEHKVAWSQEDSSVESQNDKNTENVIQSETKWSEELNNTPIDSSDKSLEWQEILSSSDSSFTNEQKDAYQFAKQNWITTKDTIQSAQMNWKLTRIAMAKMLSQYAINVLWKTPDTSKTIKFKDVTSKKDADYDNGVTLAYQLWIMWQNMKDNKFRPNDEVTRAEFVTALSRLLYSTSDWEYKSTSKYYTHHMEKLVNEWIITKADPKMKERRWYVMIMLMRSVK